jgi:hypothetical protein
MKKLAVFVVITVMALFIMADITSRNVTLPYQIPQPPPTLPVSVPPSAGTQEIKFDFTYTLKDDGTITIILDRGPFISKAITGPDAGSIFYIGGVSIDGVITPDGKTITLSAGAPDVYTINPPAVPGYVRTSICHGSGVLIWQHE